MDAGTPWIRAAVAALGSWAVAELARRARALTRSGEWAAALCGTVLIVAGGWPYVVLVGTFFLTSSALTRLEPRGPQAPRSADRRGRRWDQVVANGGVATLCAALQGLTGWPGAFVAAAGSVAAATADTWATELGRWSPVPPRLVTTWAPVPPGTSGGITLLGTLASLGGASLIGLAAGALGPAGHPVRVGAAVALAGASGAVLDSVLGATAERVYPWVGNSAVNLAATLWGALVSLLAAR